MISHKIIFTRLGLLILAVFSHFTMTSTNNFDHIPNAFVSHTDSKKEYDSKTGKSHLGVDFQPCNFSVVCGRGKESFNHIGNRRFRIIAGMAVDRYSQVGTSKRAKSAIVSEIIDVISEAGGKFCRYKRGAWFEVGDHYAREKVGALMRDLLHTRYRSSYQAKIDRRRGARKQNKKDKQQSSQQLVVGTGHSDDSSLSSSEWGVCKDACGFEYLLGDDIFDIDVF
jgi:hypothetical protein